MKPILSTLFFMLVTVSLAAQTASWQWPVEGKKAGDDMLRCPQAYIGNEFNFCDLIVETKENATILSPANGTITSMNLVYMMTLTSSFSIANEKGDYQLTIEAAKENFEKKYGDIKYLSSEIAITLIDGSRLWIGGIMPQRNFRTGDKVKRGEVLGKARFAYKPLKCSCIKLSHSYPGGQAADPMKEFGIKSSYIAPSAKKIKEVLTREEAIEDYNQLAQVVKAIYPCLDDLITPAAFDTLVKTETAAFPALVNTNRWNEALRRFNSLIHDSHVAIFLRRNERPKEIESTTLPIAFDCIGGNVIVTRTTDAYKNYIGRELKEVDQMPVSEIVEKAALNYNNFDGGVRSVREEALAMNLTFDFHKNFRRPLPTDQKTHYLFMDGETLEAPLEPYVRNQDIYGVNKKLMRYLSLNRSNYTQRTNFINKELDSLTAYIGLCHFEINQVETDELVHFIAQMEAKKKPNLILDLRNNPGGTNVVLERLIGCFLNKEPRKKGGYSMVNHKAVNGTLNFIEEDTMMFAGFRPVKGQEGFYDFPDEIPPKLDSAVHYSGRLYVLVNSNTCSAASDFAGVMVRNRRGYVAGHETQTAYHYMKAVKFANIMLKHSQCGVRIPVVKWVTDETVCERLPYNRGVIPDLNLPLTLDELYCDGDFLLDKVRQLIANGVYLSDKDPFADI